MNPTKEFSCPLYKDCVGNGKAFMCSYAVKPTKKNGRKVLTFEPRCFKTFRRKDD